MPNNDEWNLISLVGTKLKPRTDKYLVREIYSIEDQQMEQNSKDPRGIINEAEFWNKRILSCIKKEDGTLFTSEELSKISRPLKNELISIWSYVNDVDEERFLASITQSNVIQSLKA